MAGDSEVEEQAWFPCSPLHYHHQPAPPPRPPPQSPIPKGISWKGVSCGSGVLLAEELLRWLFFREAGLQRERANCWEEWHGRARRAPPPPRVGVWLSGNEGWGERRWRRPF